jgi:hypothetical protein
LQDCGFSAFLEAFVLNQSLGFFRNFGAESPQPRKALERQAVKKTPFSIKLQNIPLV